jgi:uncharacterized membrane protein YpjA
MLNKGGTRMIKALIYDWMIYNCISRINSYAFKEAVPDPGTASFFLFFAIPIIAFETRDSIIYSMALRIFGAEQDEIGASRLIYDWTIYN